MYSSQAWLLLWLIFHTNGNVVASFAVLTGVQIIYYKAWWRHQMETFSALLALCAGNSPVTGEFPAQRPVTWSFNDFFDLHLNKRLSKQSRGWWFETPSGSLWRHSNGVREERGLGFMEQNVAFWTKGIFVRTSVEGHKIVDVVIVYWKIKQTCL